MWCADAIFIFCFQEDDDESYVAPDARRRRMEPRQLSFNDSSWLEEEPQFSIVSDY